VTSSAGASFSFRFYGTDFTIYGAKRGNHGNYRGSLDGRDSAIQSGASQTAVFNFPLYNGETSKGWHNVTLTNLEDKFLDIDWVSLYTFRSCWPSPNLLGAFTRYRGEHTLAKTTSPSLSTPIKTRTHPLCTLQRTPGHRLCLLLGHSLVVLASTLHVLSNFHVTHTKDQPFQRDIYNWRLTCANLRSESFSCP